MFSLVSSLKSVKVIKEFYYSIKHQEERKVDHFYIDTIRDSLSIQLLLIIEIYLSQLNRHIDFKKRKCLLY